MTHPAPRPAVPPSAVAGYVSGKVPANLLFQVDSHTGASFTLAELPMRAMKALHAAAAAAGHTIGTTGRFRSYDQQVTLFLARYSPTPIAGRPTKQWNGKTYWQKPGVAMAAAPPGTNPTTKGSNHGWGCADDTTWESQAAFQWMCDNAESFGFAWDTTSSNPDNEDWHLQWFMGDTMPQRVLDYEHPTPPDPETPPHPIEDDLMITVYSCTDANAVFVGMADKTGAAINIQWLTEARMNAFIAQGAAQAKYASTAYKTCVLEGPLPTGDARKSWQLTDFAGQLPGTFN